MPPPSGSSVLCFSHPGLLWGAPQGVAAGSQGSSSRVPLGAQSSHWRAAIPDGGDILVYRYGRKYSIPQGSVHFSSVAQPCPTLCDPMDCSTPGLPVHHQLPEFTQAHPLSQWCHPTISSSIVPFSSHLQSFPASGSFQESVLRIRWPKCWSFSFSISPSNEYSGWFSLRKRLTLMFA